jgi:error-prone DNA polymerase
MNWWSKLHYGYNQLAITDRNTFAGIVRAHAAAKRKTFALFPVAGLI